MRKTCIASLVTLVIFFLPATFLWAQSKAPLTNASIIKMVKSGLDNDIVTTTIDASPGKYDVTPDGLISLKTAGVPTAVIKSMQAKMDTGKTPKAPGTPPPPGTGSVPQPESLNAIYAYNKTSKGLRPLEKAVGTLKAHGGLAGTTNTCEIPGPKSGTRLAQEETSFFINTGGSSPEALRLFKVESKSKVRSATISKVSGFGKMTGVKGNIPCQVKMVKQGTFEIVPEGKLDQGEYFFTLKQMDFGNLASQDAFAFGVD